MENTANAFVTACAKNNIEEIKEQHRLFTLERLKIVCERKHFEALKYLCVSLRCKPFDAYRMALMHSDLSFFRRVRNFFCKQHHSIIRQIFQEGKIACILQLIKYGFVDFDGGVRLACASKHQELISLMIQHGAENWDQMIKYACEYENIPLLKLAIQKGAPSSTFDFEVAAEWCASKKNCVMFQMLVDSRPDDALDLFKIVSYHNEVEMMEYLFQSYKRNHQCELTSEWFLENHSLPSDDKMLQWLVKRNLCTLDDIWKRSLNSKEYIKGFKYHRMPNDIGWYLDETEYIGCENCYDYRGSGEVPEGWVDLVRPEDHVHTTNEANVHLEDLLTADNNNNNNNIPLQGDFAADMVQANWNAPAPAGWGHDDVENFKANWNAPAGWCHDDVENVQNNRNTHALLRRNLNQHDANYPLKWLMTYYPEKFESNIHQIESAYILSLLNHGCESVLKHPVSIHFLKTRTKQQNYIIQTMRHLFSRDACFTIIGRFIPYK